jgi:hypothetical protein
MATHDHPADESDLDALIGDIRREAARRRAAPDFPIDEEARLAAAMDRLGPVGQGVDLAAVLAELNARAAPRAHGGTPTGSPLGVRGVARRFAGRGPGDRSTDDPTALGDVAALTASALRGLAARLADLERRLDRVAASAGGPGPATVDGTDLRDEHDLGHWLDAAAGLLSPEQPGRVLVAGPGAGVWVARLSERGADAYGVDPSLGEFADTGPVRAGEVAGHLQQLGAGSLALAVLVHAPSAPGGSPTGQVDPVELAAALHRAAGRVAVVSEAPWWWLQRVGPPACDTRLDRPLVAETWMAVLGAAGYEVTAEYGPGGHDYLVKADRRR